MKLHEKIFLALVLFIPTQLSIFFWPDYAFVKAIRVDYLAPVLYFTDILIFLLFITSFFDKQKLAIYKRNNFKLFSLFTIFAILNIYFATLRVVSLFRWIKLLEVYLVFLYASNVSDLVKRYLPKIILIDLILVLIISVIQINTGSSVGGFLYFLGERTFTSNTTGIALMSINGIELLRPYATFAHPNSLSGWVFMAGGVAYYFEQSKYIKYLIIFLSTFLIAISYSQNVWLAILTSILLVYFFRNNLRNLIYKFLFLAILFSLTFPLFANSSLVSITTSQEIRQRIELAIFAGYTLKINPLFGIGLGNFVKYIPDISNKLRLAGYHLWLQPIHNIYLLLFAETGLIGLIGFVYLFRKFISKIKTNSVITFLVIGILFIGLFDHYLITLQQNILMLAFTLGILISDNIDNIQTVWKS